MTSFQAYIDSITAESDALIARHEKGRKEADERMASMAKTIEGQRRAHLQACGFDRQFNREG